MATRVYSASGDFSFSGTTFDANHAAGPSIINEAATATNPTVVANQADPNTGLGWKSTDIGTLTAGGLEVVAFGETGSAPTLGFYATTATAQLTGVAESAAGIHAALVTLGLITA